MKTRWIVSALVVFWSVSVVADPEQAYQGGKVLRDAATGVDNSDVDDRDMEQKIGDTFKDIGAGKDVKDAIRDNIGPGPSDGPTSDPAERREPAEPRDVGPKSDDGPEGNDGPNGGEINDAPRNERLENTA